jgi:hypothetical protein
MVLERMMSDGDGEGASMSGRLPLTPRFCLFLQTCRPAVVLVLVLPCIVCPRARRGCRSDEERRSGTEPSTVGLCPAVLFYPAPRRCTGTQEYDVVCVLRLRLRLPAQVRGRR